MFCILYFVLCTNMYTWHTAHARIISMSANSREGPFCIWDIWLSQGWVGHLLTSTSKLGKHLVSVGTSLSSDIWMGQGRVEGRRVISWHQHLNCAGTSIHKSHIWVFADSIICCACKLMSGYWTLFIQGSGRREDHLLTSTSKVCIVHFSWMLFQINSVTVSLFVYPN